jgi:hypothetical protein
MEGRRTYYSYMHAHTLIGHSIPAVEVECDYSSWLLMTWRVVSKSTLATGETTSRS